MTLKGSVTDTTSGQPLEGITVTLLPSHLSAITNAKGLFLFKKTADVSSLSFSSVGYSTKTISLDEFIQNKTRISLTQQSIELSTVTVSSHAGEQYRPISKADIAMRGVANSQEVLRIVPGLFIGQHQGGGKAEQIFLRGFELRSWNRHWFICRWYSHKPGISCAWSRLCRQSFYYTRNH